MSHTDKAAFMMKVQARLDAINDGHQFDDAYAVAPAAMSDEQIALRDAMTVTAVDQAESIAALSASLHAHLDGLCKSVERLERERDEMRKQFRRLIDKHEIHGGFAYASIPLEEIGRIEKLLAGG